MPSVWTHLDWSVLSSFLKCLSLPWNSFGSPPTLPFPTSSFGGFFFLNPLQLNTVCTAWCHVLLSPWTYWCQCCPVSLLRCYSPHSLLAPLMSRPQLKPVIICCGASWALSRPRLGTKDMARGKKKKERPLEWWKCTELMRGWWTKNAHE